MQFNVYSVHDLKASAFLPPFFMANDAMACRIFTECARDSKHQFGKWPGDYILYRIGTFDDLLGFVQGLAVPVSLGLASTFLSLENSQEFDHEN